MSGESDLVLEQFKEGKELSTTDIIKEVYKHEWEASNNLSEEEKKIARSRIHRKGIYHLNKLVKNNILRVSKYAKKGEKVFELKQSGNIIINLPKKRMELSRNPFELKGLEIELDKEIVIPYSPFGVMINALILNVSNIENIAQLNSMIKELYKEVNDVIAVTNSEKLLSRTSMPELQNFFAGISQTLNGERKLSIIIDLHNPFSSDINKIGHLLASEDNKSIELTFLINEEDLLSKTKLLSQIIDLYQESDMKLNFSLREKNIIFTGKSGAYTTPHVKEAKAISSNSVAVDIAKIKELKMSASQIKELFLKIAKSFHEINVKQKTEAQILFPAINVLNADLEGMNNVIRVWNYDWKNDEYLFELLEEIKHSINDFTITQENIYKSCGFPVDFKIKLGSAFKTFSEKLSSRQYEKSLVHNIDELKNLASTYLSIRLKYDGLMNQGDRVRIFRSKGHSKEIIRELHYLITKEIKFFTYDFRKMGQLLNLRDFM